MAEITRKSVLVKCLGIIRSELEICSKNYNGLEPKEGMEQLWQECRQEIDILKDLIHAYDSESVRAALANWQRDVMAHGPSAMTLDGGMKIPEGWDKEDFTGNNGPIQPMPPEEWKRWNRP